VSWVCGKGLVDWTGSYDEPMGQVLLEGCDLGIPYESYLWRVFERWTGPPKDWYVLRTGTMGPSCTLLAPDGRGTITRLTRAVPLLLGWKVIV
jgi:hypothetical protein